MTTSEFMRHWHEHYPGAPPVGYLLRDAFPERWFRIHSLPEAQRYAVTPWEHRELLRRQNALITRLIGDGGHLVLLRTGYSDGPLPRRPDGGPGRLPPPGRRLLGIPAGDDDDGTPGWYTHTFMGNHAWRPGSMNDLLRLVAREELTGVLFVGVERPCVIAPYDGGVDVILASEEERDRERSAHAAWLSPYPSGL